MHKQPVSQMSTSGCTKVRNMGTCTEKHIERGLKTTHDYARSCRPTRHSEIQVHSVPNLLLHTIPTSNSLWEQAMQRQHTHSHTNSFCGHGQITGKCATNCQIFTARLSLKPWMCVQRLVWKIPKVGYFSSHVQWGIKVLKSTPN